jgi:hypothetical protein
METTVQNNVQDMINYANSLKASATIMFTTLNRVNQLHASVFLEGEQGPIEACQHCSEIADAIVHFPCPTVQILTEHMVVEEEETPAE